MCHLWLCSNYAPETFTRPEIVESSDITTYDVTEDDNISAESIDRLCKLAIKQF